MAKKQKRKLKKSFKIIIVIILLIISFIIYNKYDSIYLKYFLGYKQESIMAFKNEKITNKIKSNKYSKTLETAILNSKYNYKYLDEYINIKYVNKNNFIDNINLLLELGYNSKNINNINNKLNDKNIELLTTSTYDKNIDVYLELEYFNEEYLSRYLNYHLINKNITAEEVITYVNIGLDNDYYTNTTEIKNTNDILLLVNKYNYLTKDYSPNDLTTISSKYAINDNQKLRQEAKQKFEEMAKDAQDQNIDIKAGSAYRSYSYQNNLYNKYVLQDGKSLADTYSARPGYSEHQTGLAVDIVSNNLYVDEIDTKEAYQWLINNSYKYGFILRYPKDKEKITGYMFEDWHYRYLGINIAKEIYDKNITYDEYIAKKKVNN